VPFLTSQGGRVVCNLKLVCADRGAISISPGVFGNFAQWMLIFCMRNSHAFATFLHQGLSKNRALLSCPCHLKGYLSLCVCLCGCVHARPRAYACDILVHAPMVFS
jgi:hypothetical protein